MDLQLKHAIEVLVIELANGSFDVLERDGRLGRVSVDEIRTAIADYGRHLLPLPDEAWPLVDEYPQEDDPTSIALDLPMWTREEGRSDLTLQLMARNREGRWTVEISDLHVL